MLNVVNLKFLYMHESILSMRVNVRVLQNACVSRNLGETWRKSVLHNCCPWSNVLCMHQLYSHLDLNRDNIWKAFYVLFDGYVACNKNLFFRKKLSNSMWWLGLCCRHRKVSCAFRVFLLLRGSIPAMARNQSGGVIKVLTQSYKKDCPLAQLRFKQAC